ncbi:MAG: 50S ribosome-binding GTPase [Bacteroidetes bacterium]|nr:50S ribosome-binding GTPase [Bacteroidota bacterium]
MQNTNGFISEDYMNVELLRFTTAGSVDDGKSTLIGRLLYDSKAIFEDQLESIKLASERRGEESINFALLTDGLKAEREQGITIDVAYRYFATPKRKFIIADTPGHVQYTRNMVTGASTANLAIILIDARKGVVEQTKRHSYIASLLGIKHLALCINKMDLVDYSQDVFEEIVNDFKVFASKLHIHDINYIPISALYGDNIVEKSEKMQWYAGSTLMYFLETVHVGSDHNLIDGRFPVQNIIRVNNAQTPDYRGYAGRVGSGVFKVGDEVKVLPSGLNTVISGIEGAEGNIDMAFAPMSVVLRLANEIDISRGDMIVPIDNLPKISREIDAMICWMNPKKLITGNKFIIRHTTKEAKCVVTDINYCMDINQIEEISNCAELNMNDIGCVTIKTSHPILFDKYHHNRNTGSIILVDETTNETVAAGMIV